MGKNTTALGEQHHDISALELRLTQQVTTGQDLVARRSA
jgi:hypothetical protein